MVPSVWILFSGHRKSLEGCKQGDVWVCFAFFKDQRAILLKTSKRSVRERWWSLQGEAVVAWASVPSGEGTRGGWAPLGCDGFYPQVFCGCLP